MTHLLVDLPVGFPKLLLERERARLEQPPLGLLRKVRF